MTGSYNHPTPVNAYDPGMEDFSAQAHRTIREELSSVGEVVEITGTITPTQRYGVQFDGVQAKVKNPIFGIPVVFGVNLNEQRKIQYFTAPRDRYYDTDNVFTPVPTGGYGAGLVSPEQRVVDDLFERMRNHPAVSWWDRSEELRPPELRLTLTGVGATVGTGAASGALMAADVLGPAALLAVPAVGVGSYVHYRKNTASFTKAWKEHRSAAEWWNEHPKEVLPTLLNGQGEMSRFVEALIGVCERYGVSYEGSLEVMSTIRWSKHDTPEHPYNDTVQYDVDDIAKPGVAFVGTPTGSELQFHLAFDGTYLYHVLEGDEREGRPTDIAVIAAPR